MDDGKSNVAHGGTGCTLLDNAGDIVLICLHCCYVEDIVLKVGLRLM